MKIRTEWVDEFKRGYDEGWKVGYDQGYKEGLEDGRDGIDVLIPVEDGSNDRPRVGDNLREY